MRSMIPPWMFSILTLHSCVLRIEYSVTKKRAALRRPFLIEFESSWAQGGGDSGSAAGCETAVRLVG